MRANTANTKNLSQQMNTSPAGAPPEAGTALFVIARLATRPPHALSALLIDCQQKTLPAGIGSESPIRAWLWREKA